MDIRVHVGTPGMISKRHKLIKNTRQKCTKEQRGGRDYVRVKCYGISVNREWGLFIYGNIWGIFRIFFFCSVLTLKFGIQCFISSERQNVMHRQLSSSQQVFFSILYACFWSISTGGLVIVQKEKYKKEYGPQAQKCWIFRGKTGEVREAKLAISHIYLLTR